MTEILYHPYHLNGNIKVNPEKMCDFTEKNTFINVKSWTLLLFSSFHGKIRNCFCGLRYVLFFKYLLTYWFDLYAKSLKNLSKLDIPFNYAKLCLLSSELAWLAVTDLNHLQLTVWKFKNFSALQFYVKSILAFGRKELQILWRFYLPKVDFT